ncbi:MAG: response regulator [Kofleriaceae bacterium]
MTVLRKRVLFVDDDPEILAGLRNLLYKERKLWDMVFADSGDAALTQLSGQPFDVVVSDMRMPGMDGATLLSRVKDKFPSTARIMLSGHAEREAIVRALPALHQLLSKPCDATTLRTAIERGFDHAVATRDARVRDVIGRIDNLPTPPDLFFELTRAMTSHTTTLDDVAKIVLRDPALSAKLLQLVNSAYFGSGQKTSSIQHAISLLGTERLRYISLTASVFSAVKVDPFPELTVRDLQISSARTATITRALLANQPGRDEAFAAALLHDVGHVVLITGMTEAYRPVVQRWAADHEAMTVVENDLIGVTHAEVGACLLGLWGLPTPIIEIVRHHHDPGSAPEALRLSAAVVHVADVLAHPDAEDRLDLASLERAGVIDKLPQWRDIARSA